MAWNETEQQNKSAYIVAQKHISRIGTGIGTFVNSKISYKKKQWEATKQKEEKRKKPKPKEREGMPQRRQCLHGKRRGDRNPECHEEHQKDVA
jgi:hypothetical protein